MSHCSRARRHCRCAPSGARQGGRKGKPRGGNETIGARVLLASASAICCELAANVARAYSKGMAVRKRALRLTAIAADNDLRLRNV